MAQRDLLGDLVAYNKPLTDTAHQVPLADGKGNLTTQALARKLDALAASPFGFFRGTFHLMCKDLFEARVPGAGSRSPEGLIVGDLHLENFGIYRGQSGELTFDVNDFDDVGFGPIDLDLKRLCTSAFLLPGLAAGVRAAAAKSLARAWVEELEKLGGRFPIPPWTGEKADGRVASLLGERGRKKPAELIAKAAPDKGHKQLDLSGTPSKYARPAKSWVKTVNESVARYFDSLKQLKAPGLPRDCQVLDVAYRFKGAGSLGRLRFTALVAEGETRRLFEFKETRQSALDEMRARPPGIDRARTQTAAIRRLQGDPWPRVAATSFGKVPALGREIEAEEGKIDSAEFAKGDAHHEELNAYVRQCGAVLARLHCRENAPILLDAAWSPAECARAAVEFAEHYAIQVEKDQLAFVKGRSEVAHALGLPAPLSANVQPEEELHK